MPEWGVIPSIRVRDMAEALAFYRERLEFTLDSGDDAATNSSLTRGDAHVMLETAADRSLAVLPGVAARMDALIAEGHGGDDLAMIGKESIR